MPTFQPSKPQATDILSVSQADIQGNFESSNTSFGVDHYAFDATSSNGFHKTVTTPDQVTDPTTVGLPPKFYAKSVLTTPKILQFSRIGNDGVPTPLTTFNISGTIVPNGFANLIDMAGAAADTMIRCAIVIRTTAGAPSMYNFGEFIFSFTGAGFQSQANPAPANAVIPALIATPGGAQFVIFSSSGTTLQVVNNTGATISYNATISFIRIL
jgi:hypothetical protein